MKKYKFTLLLIIATLFSGCSLDEEPPFLSNKKAYGSANHATSTLTGIYQSVAAYDYYGRQFLTLANLNSGFGVTKRGGNRNNNPDNVTICSLKPTGGTIQLVNAWEGIYASIGRANDAIKFAVTKSDPINDDEKIINDVVGQAYFIRAFNYFNLVRMWGEVPLRLAPTTKETIHLARSPIKDVYIQIIKDVEKAQELMNGFVANGTVKPEAANMLLAKIYMTLATAPPEHQKSGLDYWKLANVDYWKLAYEEAKKVYGKYSLHPSYDELFREITGDNTNESIFELQSSEAATTDHVRAFTPSKYIKATTFGLLQAHSEVYDMHADTYPKDLRLKTTYISKFVKSDGKTFRTYPTNQTRKNFAVGFPFVLKLGARSQNQVSRSTSKNFKIYRYADLLLMLAEISNELQNGEQLKYVEEVIYRGKPKKKLPADYSGGKEAFRKAIMKEYQFELFFEGHDWFNNRRRGYDYFLNNVILPHNNAEKFNVKVDVTLETREAMVMYLPLPLIEKDTNQLIK